MDQSIFFINGRFLDQKDATISVMDHGFLYGDGVFEAFRLNDGKIFHLDDHIDRLYDSARIIDLDVPYTKEALKDIIIEAVRRSGFSDCYIRPQVTRGLGPLGHNPDTCPKATVVVYVTPTPQMKGNRTIRTIVSCYRRPPAYVLPPESKMTQYLNNILAKIEARKQGVDDAIFLDMRGFVSEGCAWNIFVVKENAVVTPSATSSILNGITRRVAIKLLAGMNIPVTERDVTLSELFTADEVFGTGTASEITPVVEINGRAVGDGHAGTCTRALEQRFKAYIAANGTPINSGHPT